MNTYMGTIERAMTDKLGRVAIATQSKIVRARNLVDVATMLSDKYKDVISINLNKVNIT